MDERTLIWEWKIEGLTQEEIAERHNITQPEVSRAMKDLRVHFETRAARRGTDWVTEFVKDMESRKHHKVVMRDADELIERLDEAQEEREVLEEDEG